MTLAGTGSRRTPHLHVIGMSLQKSCGRLLQFLVEILSETANERLLQKFIYSDTLFPAFLESASANVPTMQVQGIQAVSEDGDTDRIQPA